MNATLEKRSPWPYAIIGFFIVFVTAMGAWIHYAVHQNMDLVGTDYYEQEIKFQQQIDRVNRAKGIGSEVSVRYQADQQSIVVKLPITHVQEYTCGVIQLYRPSDASLDRNIPLSLDGVGTQRLETKNLRPGLWKIRIRWSARGQDYSIEQPVVIGGL